MGEEQESGLFQEEILTSALVRKGGDFLKVSGDSLGTGTWRRLLDATNSTALPAGGVQWGGTGKQVAAPTLDRKVEFHPLVS